MALDSIRVFKMESPTQGGTQLDVGPTEADPHNDAIPAPAIFLQAAGGNAAIDQAVSLDRIGSALRLTDTTTSHVLGELVSATAGQVGSHNALPDIIHYLADAGPADAFASGAYLQIVRNGPLVTSKTWYTNNSLTTKIYAVSYTYSGPLVATETRTLFAANNAVLRQITDTIQYSGPLPTGRTRTWS